MKMKVKQFLSYGDLIIHDVKIDSNPLMLKYGEYISDDIMKNANFQKSMKSGIVKKCIDKGWIIIEKEEKKEDKEVKGNIDKEDSKK